MTINVVEVTDRSSALLAEFGSRNPFVFDSR